MPNGKGCRRRQGETFRLRKNDEFMAKIRSQMFAGLGINIDYEGRTEQEVEDLGRAMIRELLDGNKAVASVVACDVYHCDDVLVESIIAESQDIEVVCDDVEDIPSVKMISHELHNSDDQCSATGPDCEESDSCEFRGKCVPLTHLDHSNHNIIQSGELIRCCNAYCSGCEVQPINEETGVLLKPGYPAEVIQTVVVQDQVFPTASVNDVYLGERLCNTDQKRVCKCVYNCQHAIDKSRAFEKCRKLVKDFRYDVYQAMIETLPPEMVNFVEQNFSCREKFLLTLYDGRPRVGCSNQGIRRGSGYKVTPGGLGCGKSLIRCICQSSAFKYGCTDSLRKYLRQVKHGTQHSLFSEVFHVHYA